MYTLKKLIMKQSQKQKNQNTAAINNNYCDNKE